jgi:hypothetical protein
MSPSFIRSTRNYLVFLSSVREEKSSPTAKELWQKRLCPRVYRGSLISGLLNSSEKNKRYLRTYACKENKEVAIRNVKQ